MKKLLIGGMLASLCCTAALAYEGPKFAFDATYSQTGPQGTNILRMASDGKGHMRTETTAAGQKMVTISDYPGKVAYTVMEAQHMAMRIPLKDNGPEVHDEESAKKANAKSLGSKVVNGHPCHGWQYTTAQASTTVWTGDDINYMVKTETTVKGGPTMTMDLKSFSKKAPGADAFAVPSGYKLVELPNMAH